MSLLEKLKKLGITQDDICGHDEKLLQTSLAPIFRLAAIHHLKEGKGEVAEGFRKSYSVIAGIGERGAIGKEKKIDDFLANQQKDKVFGTYIEAAALGELLQCHVDVTPIIEGVEQTKHRLYQVKRAKRQAIYPTIHLYCENNNHWYAIRNQPKKTLMDGNCLYNAFAQQLQHHIRNALYQKNEDGPVAYRLRSKKPSFFPSEAPRSVVSSHPIPFTIEDRAHMMGFSYCDPW